MEMSRKTMYLCPIFALVLLLTWGVPGAGAGVSVSINLGPPPIVMAQPPEVVMVPGSQVYFVPDPYIDVFFYAGYWWSPRGTRWYRSLAYNGQWVHVVPAVVPRAVIYMPRDYRVRYAHAPRYPYGHWVRDHHRWENQNRHAQKRWEKEREKEWKRRSKNERYNRDYLRGNGPGGQQFRSGGPGPGHGDRQVRPDGRGPGPGDRKVRSDSRGPGPGNHGPKR